MTNVINLILTFLIIFLGNKIAPEYIIINSWEDAALAAVIIMLIEAVACFIVELILTPLMLVISSADSDITIIIGFVITIVICVGGICAATFGSFVAADKLLDGFACTTTGTYIVLAILDSILSVSSTGTKVKQK